MMRSGMFAVWLLAFTSVSADTIDLEREGWHSWRVATHDSDHEVCCLEWNSGRAEPVTCDLDDRRGGFSSTKRIGESSAQMQVYTLLEKGAPIKVRALSPDCAVRTTTEIRDLGLIDSDASFKWLRQFASPHSNISADVLSAIAMHEGSGPRDELLRVATHDKDQHNREAAVFAISQLATDQAIDTLIQVVEKRELDFDTRRSALFWLAQVDSDRVVDYFSELLAAK
jgi:hypothetical protein